jgi:cellulose synthase operon protein C
VVSSLLLCLALAGCGDANQRESKYIRRGMEYLNNGDFEKARIEFKNAAKIKPTDAEVRYRLGLVDEAQGDLRNAFANFSHAAEQDAHYHPALLKIAQYYIAAEQFEQASANLNTVLTDTPDDAEGHALRAALALRHKNLVETENEARLSLQKDPANITAFSVLTGLYAAKGDEAKALETIDAALVRNPGNLSLLQLRVALYLKMNDVDKLGDAYNAIFKLRPHDVHFRTELAGTYLKLKRLDEAEAVLRGGIKDGEDGWPLKQQLVSFLSENRGLDAAETEVRNYIAQSPKKDDLYFWLADLYLRHQSVDRAVDLLQQVISKDDLKVQGLNARTSLARISFSRGDRTLAEKLIAVVLGKAPNNHQALFLRAGMSFEAGQFQSAVSDLRSILREQPNSPDALQMLSEVLLRQGHLDLATDTLNQLVELNPVDPSTRVRLAQLYHINNDNKRALEILDVINKANPTFAVGWETSARVNLDLNNLDAAEVAISQLDKLEKQHMTATFLRGEKLVALKKYEDAIPEFTTVISNDPDVPLAEHALTSLVRTYTQLNRLDAAAHYIQTLKADNPFILTVLGECYLQLKDPTKAALEFDKAVAAKAPRPEPYLDKARLSLALRQVDQAIQALKQGVEAAPYDTQIPMLLADIYGAQGRHQEAIALYEDVLNRNPGFDQAANNMAELIADYQFNDTVALDKARRVTERFQSSTNPLLLDTLGWVYYRQGNQAQAMIYTQRAIAVGNVPAQVHYHAGVVLQKDNRKEEAKAQLEKAVESGQNYPGIDEAKTLLKSL